MVKVHFDSAYPPETDIADDYRYGIREGAFFLEYLSRDDPGQNPVLVHVDRYWPIRLELVTPSWTREYSIKEPPALLMSAMNDYEAEINLARIGHEEDF
jgi:hypothetical protein